MAFLLRSAHRFFIISEIRLRAAALMWRRGLEVPSLALPAGLPGRRAREPRSDSAAIALSNLEQFFHVADFEVGHAPGADLPCRV